MVVCWERNKARGSVSHTLVRPCRAAGQSSGPAGCAAAGALALVLSSQSREFDKIVEEDQANIPVEAKNKLHLSL